MKIQITLFILFIGFTLNGKAQYKRFPMSGAIRFEKSVNMYALIRNMSKGKNAAYMETMLDDYKKNTPETDDTHFEEAIMLHGGEAQLSKEGFQQMNATEKAQLIQFLKSL